MNIDPVSVPIGGRFVRIVDREWSDPLDPTFAARPPGQRWNPVGMVCLYLNADIATARANLYHRFEGLPFGPEDLDPVTAPMLIDVAISDGVGADAFTDTGLSALGLPTTYPLDADGVVIPHRVCQPIGAAAFDAGLDGVDARSAELGGIRELAWFPRGRTPDLVRRRPFEQWWPTH